MAPKGSFPDYVARGGWDDRLRTSKKQCPASLGFRVLRLRVYGLRVLGFRVWEPLECEVKYFGSALGNPTMKQRPYATRSSSPKLTLPKPNMGG